MFIVPFFFLSLGNAGSVGGVTAKCTELLLSLHDELGVFQEPVDFVALGLHDYPVTIPVPMDLSTVRARLETGFYGTDNAEVVAVFQQDVFQMFDNCMAYNTPNSDIWNYAKDLRAKFSASCASALRSLGVSKSDLTSARDRIKKTSAACRAIIDDIQEFVFPSMSTIVVLDAPTSTQEHAHRPATFDVVFERLNSGYYGGWTSCLPEFASNVLELLESFKASASTSSSAAVKKKKSRINEHVVSALNEFRRAVWAASRELTSLVSDGTKERVDVVLQKEHSLSPKVAFDGCLKLAELARSHPRADVFTDPVPKELEGYYDVIENPMCISQAQSRLRHNKPRSKGGPTVDAIVSEFVKDMRLIWRNCCQYNAQGSDIYRAALQLRDYFEYQLCAHFAGTGTLHKQQCQQEEPPVVPKLTIKPKRMRSFFYDIMDGMILQSKGVPLVSHNISQAYQASIEEPLCLQAIRHRLDWYYYVDPEDLSGSLALFVTDVRQVLSDCVACYGRASDFSSTAEKIWNYFRDFVSSKFKKMPKVKVPAMEDLLQHSSDEDNSVDEDGSESEQSDEEEVNDTDDEGESNGDESADSDSDPESNEGESSEGGGSKSEASGKKNRKTKNMFAPLGPIAALPRGKFKMLWSDTGRWVDAEVKELDEARQLILVEYDRDSTREWVRFSDMKEGKHWKSLHSRRAKSHKSAQTPTKTPMPPVTAKKKDVVEFAKSLSRRKCLFCQDSGVSAKMRQYLGPLTKIPAEVLLDKRSSTYIRLKKKDKAFYVAHMRCLEWVPEVFQKRSGAWAGIVPALKRSRKMKCSHPDCASSGCAIGCVCEDCKHSYHFGCAISLKPPCWFDTMKWQIMCPSCRKKKANRKQMKTFLKPNLPALISLAEAEADHHSAPEDSDESESIENDSSNDDAWSPTSSGNRKSGKKDARRSYLFTAPRDDDRFGSEDDEWLELGRERERSSVAAVRRLSAQVHRCEEAVSEEQANVIVPPTAIRDQPHPRIPAAALPHFLSLYQFLQTHHEFLDLSPCTLDQFEEAMLSSHGENDYVIKFASTLLQILLPDFDVAINDSAAKYVLDTLSARKQEPILANLLVTKRIRKTERVYSKKELELAVAADADLDAKNAAPHMRAKKPEHSSHKKVEPPTSSVSPFLRNLLDKISKHKSPNSGSKTARGPAMSVTFGVSYSELQAAFKHRPFPGAAAGTMAQDLSRKRKADQGSAVDNLAAAKAKTGVPASPTTSALVQPVKRSWVPVSAIRWARAPATSTQYTVTQKLAAKVAPWVATLFDGLLKPDWEIGIEMSQMCTVGATEEWAKLNWLASEEFPGFPLTLTSIAQQRCRRCDARYQIVEKRCPHCELDSVGPDTAVTGGGSTRLYTTEYAGSNINSIARQFDVSADAILRLNSRFHGLTKRSRLAKGVVVVLPAKGAEGGEELDSSRPEDDAETGTQTPGSPSEDEEDNPPPRKKQPPLMYEVVCPHCATKMPVQAGANLITCINQPCSQVLKVNFAPISNDSNTTNSRDDDDNEDDDDDGDDENFTAQTPKKIGRRSRSTRKRKPVKLFTLTMDSTFKKKSKSKNKKAPTAGAPGAIGAGGLDATQQSNTKAANENPYTPLALQFMCPKGVLLEAPHLMPKLQAGKHNWPEVLRQYLCVKAGLPRTTFGPTADAFLPTCEYVLLLLKRQSFAGAFLEPVDLVLYPDYTTYVSEPIDLDTIQHKVDDFEYKSTNEFVQDVRRVAFNALAYNEAGSKLAEVADKLLTWFEPVATLLDMWHPAPGALCDTNPKNGSFSELLPADDRSKGALDAVRSQLLAEALLTSAEVACMAVVSYKMIIDTAAREVFIINGAAPPQREPSFLKLYLKCRTPNTLPLSPAAKSLGVYNPPKEKHAFRYHHVCVLLNMAPHAHGQCNVKFVDLFKLDNERIVPRNADPEAMQYQIPIFSAAHSMYEQPSWKRMSQTTGFPLAPLTRTADLFSALRLLGSVPYEKWPATTKMSVLQFLADRVCETAAFKRSVDRARRMDNLAAIDPEYKASQRLHFDGNRCRSMGMLNGSQALWVVGPGAIVGPSAPHCADNEATDLYEEEPDEANDAVSKSQVPASARTPSPKSTALASAEEVAQLAMQEASALRNFQCPNGSKTCRGVRKYSRGFVCLDCQQLAREAAEAEKEQENTVAASNGSIGHEATQPIIASELVPNAQPTALLVQTFFDDGSDSWTGFWSVDDIQAVVRSIPRKSKSIAGVRVGGKTLKRRLARWFLQPDSHEKIQSLQSQSLPPLSKCGWKPAMVLVELLDLEEALFQENHLVDRPRDRFHESSELCIPWSIRRRAWQASLVDILALECGWESSSVSINTATGGDDGGIISCCECQRKIHVPPHMAPLVGIAGFDDKFQYRAKFKCSMADWQPFPIVCQKPRWRLRAERRNLAPTTQSEPAKLPDPVTDTTDIDDTGAPALKKAHIEAPNTGPDSDRKRKVSQMQTAPHSKTPTFSVGDTVKARPPQSVALAKGVVTRIVDKISSDGEPFVYQVQFLENDTVSDYDASELRRWDALQHGSEHILNESAQKVDLGSGDLPSYFDCLNPTLRRLYATSSSLGVQLPGAAQLLTLEMVIANNILTTKTGPHSPMGNSQYWMNRRRSWRARVASAQSFAQLSMAAQELAVFLRPVLDEATTDLFPTEYFLKPVFREDPRVSEVRRQFLREHVIPGQHNLLPPTSAEALASALTRKAADFGWQLPEEADQFNTPASVSSITRTERMRYPKAQKKLFESVIAAWRQEGRRPAPVLRRPPVVQLPTATRSNASTSATKPSVSLPSPIGPKTTSKLVDVTKFHQVLSSAHPTLIKGSLRVAGVVIDLWKLYSVVQALGGQSVIGRQNHWYLVRARFGLHTPSISSQTVERQLENLYTKYLSPLEFQLKLLRQDSALSRAKPNNSPLGLVNQSQSAAGELPLPSSHLRSSSEKSSGDELEVYNIGAGLGFQEAGLPASTVPVSAVFAAIDDTLRKISRRFCMPVSELVATNKLSADESLSDCQLVQLPLEGVAATLRNPDAVLVPIPDDLFAVSYAGEIPMTRMLLPPKLNVNGTTLPTVEGPRRPLTAAECFIKDKVVDVAVSRLNDQKVCPLTYLQTKPAVISGNLSRCKL